MNTLSMLVTDLALLWLSVELYTDLNETALGAAVLGLFFLFIYFTIQEFLNEWHRSGSGEQEEE